jgi:hypothetical protein
MKEGSAVPDYLVKALRKHSNASSRAARQMFDYEWPNSELTSYAKSLAANAYVNPTEFYFSATSAEWYEPNLVDNRVKVAKMRLALGMPIATGGDCPKK